LVVSTTVAITADTVAILTTTKGTIALTITGIITIGAITAKVARHDKLASAHKE
jgi:hypothetical protein